MLAIIQSTTRRLRLVSSGNYQYLFFAAIVTALFMLAPLQSVQAQCPCASATFQVGTGITPTPVPNMAAAIAIYGAGFSTLTSACVKINGQFTVESGTWSLTSTNVVFDNASSSLFVLGGASLIASAGSTFTPCSTSFMGIYGQTGSTINMNQCTVQGASNAGVSVLANATFSITGNTFDNCNKGLSVGGLQNTANHTVSGNTFKFCTNGIYLGAAVNVNIGSNSYTNFGGTSLMYGITMQPGSENITVGGGFFSSLDRCIEATKTRNIVISGGIFSGDIGIFAWQCYDQLRITGGIYRITVVGMEIFYHDTQAGKDILIQNNTFSTQLQDNLLIDNVGGEGKATVRNNFFSTPPFANDTFYAIEVQQAYAAEGMFIESNTINSSSAVARPGGILVNQSLEYCLIRDNSITVTSTTGVVFGIGATNCKVDMEIIGNNVNGGSANSSSGICIVNVPDDLLLCCNTLDKSNDGLYVNSDLNTNSLIYNTVFGEHAFAALHYYNVTTSTGAPQINYGNDWSGASGLWDAYFDGSPAMANMVKYQVGSTNLPSGLSKVFVTSGVPSDWFAVLGNEGSCALSDISFCGQTPGRPEGPDGGGGGEGGRSQASASYDLSVYPNPADQILSVELPDGADATFRISLRDLPGRTVIQQDVVAGTASVSLSTAKLSPGIYVLEVLQGDRRVGIFRVLIQH